MVACVIPAFRAAERLPAVVAGVLPYVDRVIVVDDACPEECGLIAQTHFAGDERVEVLRHLANRGVGGAMKTGIRRAFQLGADVIVKVDADGQMDPAHLPQMLAILEMNPRIALVKGNRFGDGSVVRSMPRVRLVGNSLLTLLVRSTTGYWNSIDPTNGYLVIRASRLRRLALERLADRYYFEISLLTALGLRRAEIAEIEMPARYGDERSSLKVGRVLTTFPFQLLRSLARRLAWQYVVSDMNVGSLFLIVGVLLIAVGTLLGGIWEYQSLTTGIPRTPGTATLVLLPLMLGFQLTINAVLYDVQAATRVYKFSGDDGAAEVRLRRTRGREESAYPATDAGAFGPTPF